MDSRNPLRLAHNKTWIAWGVVSVVVCYGLVLVLPPVIAIGATAGLWVGCVWMIVGMGHHPTTPWRLAAMLAGHASLYALWIAASPAFRDLSLLLVLGYFVVFFVSGVAVVPATRWITDVGYLWMTGRRVQADCRRRTPTVIFTRVQHQHLAAAFATQSGVLVRAPTTAARATLIALAHAQATNTIVATESPNLQTPDEVDHWIATTNGGVAGLSPTVPLGDVDLVTRWQQQHNTPLVLVTAFAIKGDEQGGMVAFVKTVLPGATTPAGVQCMFTDDAV